MSGSHLTADMRDELYTELCASISIDWENADAPLSRTELFLSRLCLLLIEQVGDPVAIRAALRYARLESDAENLQ